MKYKCAYGSEENCENYEEDEENEIEEENYPKLDMEKFNADIIGRISVI